MKRTLKRELKVPELAEREANGTSFVCETDMFFKRMLILASSVIGSLYSETTLISWTLFHVAEGTFSVESDGELDVVLGSSVSTLPTHDDQMVSFDPS